MNSLSSAIALLNIIATTLQFSSVARSSDERLNVPLNFYNMIIARSCNMMITPCAKSNAYFLFLAYGKSDITKLIRSVLGSICIAHGHYTDLCLDEFTRAGLINCLDNCTKIFMTDEADMTFVDAGLFNGFPKPSPETNCRCMCLFVVILI
jgi:hypothetical protein